MKKLLLLIAIILSLFNYLCAQKIDESFLGPIPIRPAEIRCMKSLRDGKLLIGGDINFYNDKNVKCLIRLNPDASIDETFNFDTSEELIITQFEEQSNSDIIVLAVYKNRYNTFLLLRLNANGEILKTIDTLKSPVSLALQLDDKLLIGGGDWSKGYIYRYNLDLSSDSVFNNKVSVNDKVNFVTTDSSFIYISGYFSKVNGITKNDIVKLYLDGSIDSTFDTGIGTESDIGSFTIDENNKILISAFFNSFNGNPIILHPTRINADGSVDYTFGTFLNTTYPISKLIIKDSLYYLAASLRNSPFDYLGEFLIRLGTNGVIDTTFKPVKLDNFGGINNFCVNVSDSNILFNNSTRTGNKFGLSRCDLHGNIDTTFNPEVGRYGTVTACDFFNGDLIIAGDFIRISNTNTFGIAKLDKCGKIDPTFILKEQHGSVEQIKILNANEILISTWEEFFKINKKAEIQTDFNFHFFKNLYEVIKFKPLNNGKIIVADYNHLYCLKADGSPDTAYSYGDTIYTHGCPFDFDERNNKIIYGTYLTNLNNTFKKFLFRINEDGSFDESFDIGTGPDSTVYLVKILNNGDVLIGGDFKNFNGVKIPHGLVKLNWNGVIDTTFLENQEKIGWFNVGNFMFKKRIINWEDKIIMNGKWFINVLNLDGSQAIDLNNLFSFSRVDDIVEYEDSILISDELLFKASGDDLISDKSDNSYLQKNKLNEVYGNKVTYNKSRFLFATGSFIKQNETDISYLIKLELSSKIYSDTSRIDTSSSVDSTDTTVNYQNHRMSNNIDFIYPNPASNYLHFKFSGVETKELKLIIYTINGEKILESTYSNLKEENIISENVSFLDTGIYYVKLYSDKSQSPLLPFIKK